MHKHQFPPFWRAYRQKATRSLAGLLALFIAHLAHAASIPLETAIEQAIEASQIEELAEAARREADSIRQAASTLPNPSLFYERETLNGSGPASDSRETTFGIAAPLDFIWKRGSRIKAAEQRGNFAVLQIKEQQRQLSRNVSRLFVEHAANILESQRHESAHAALYRARAVAHASVEAGDFPPTFLQRVDLALARHISEDNRIQTERLAIQARFAAYLADHDAEPKSANLSLDIQNFSNEREALEAAAENRPDLKAAAALLAWKQTEQKSTQRDGLPALSLEVGQKEDNIGRDGAFLGLSVEVPIFERNQAGISIARVESARAEIAHLQAQRLVEGEVRSAYLAWKKLSEIWQASQAQPSAIQNAESLLAATEASFEAGESSLLEYLDAVEAYLETAEQEIELQKAWRFATIELAHTTATPIQN